MSSSYKIDDKSLDQLYQTVPKDIVEKFGEDAEWYTRLQDLGYEEEGNDPYFLSNSIVPHLSSLRTVVSSYKKADASLITYPAAKMPFPNISLVGDSLGNRNAAIVFSSDVSISYSSTDGLLEWSSGSETLYTGPGRTPPEYIIVDIQAPGGHGGQGGHETVVFGNNKNWGGNGGGGGAFARLLIYGSFKLKYSTVYEAVYIEWTYNGNNYELRVHGGYRGSSNFYEDSYENPDNWRLGGSGGGFKLTKNGGSLNIENYICNSTLGPIYILNAIEGASGGGGGCQKGDDNPSRGGYIGRSCSANLILGTYANQPLITNEINITEQSAQQNDGVGYGCGGAGGASVCGKGGNYDTEAEYGGGGGGGAGSKGGIQSGKSGGSGIIKFYYKTS